MPKGKGRRRQDDSFHFLSPQSSSLCDSRISNASLCRCSPLALQYKVKLNAELNYLLDIFFLKAQLPYIHTQTRVYACVCVCVLWYVAQSKDVSSCSCQITKSFRLVYVCKLVAFSLCITSQPDFAARYQVFLSYLFQAHTHTQTDY